MDIFFQAFFYIITGLWICYKRDWYDMWDEPAIACICAVVFMPLNLLVVFFKEFLLNKWDNFEL